MIRVFLAHTEFLIRQGLRSILFEREDIEVVGETGDGREAFALIESLLPDVAILDGELPSPNGPGLTRMIRLSTPRVMVMVLGADDGEGQLFEAIKAGAAAYFPRSVAGDQLVDGIRRLSQGEYLINESLVNSPRVAARVLKQFQTLSVVLKPVRPLMAPLSFREAEILEYIARGEKNKRIAHALGTTEQTVKNQVSSILRKLNANDRTQAVVKAVQRGWIPLCQPDDPVQPGSDSSADRLLSAGVR